MSVHGKTHLPKQKKKATLLMKTEGERKKVKVEWKNLQEFNKGNKGSFMQAAVSLQKWQDWLRHCCPVFLIQKFSLIRALLVPRR